MSVFEDIRLEWSGKKYTIPSDRVMRAIARVEDIVTFKELHDHTQRNTLPMAKISMAFGSLLRYAGAQVEDDEVYEGMFDGRSDAAGDAVRTLISIMFPPSTLRAAVSAEGNPEGPSGGGPVKRARKSKKPSSSRAGRAKKADGG